MLLEKKYDDVIYYSNLGLKFNQEQYTLNFNKSYALFLLGKVEEGNRLYQKNLTLERSSRKKCKLKEDFDLLKKSGITHSVFRKLSQDLEKFCK